MEKNATVKRVILNNLNTEDEISRDIKTRLENSEKFKYWNKEVGITFDDFKIIDVVKKKQLCGGTTRLGDCYIFILDSDKIRVCYDL